MNANYTAYYKYLGPLSTKRRSNKGDYDDYGGRGVGRIFLPYACIWLHGWVCGGWWMFMGVYGVGNFQWKSEYFDFASSWKNYSYLRHGLRSLWSYMGTFTQYYTSSPTYYNPWYLIYNSLWKRIFRESPISSGSNTNPTPYLKLEVMTVV